MSNKRRKSSHDDVPPPARPPPPPTFITAHPNLQQLLRSLVDTVKSATKFLKTALHVANTLARDALHEDEILELVFIVRNSILAKSAMHSVDAADFIYPIFYMTLTSVEKDVRNGRHISFPDMSKQTIVHYIEAHIELICAQACNRWDDHCPNCSQSHPKTERLCCSKSDNADTIHDAAPDVDAKRATESSETAFSSILTHSPETDGMEMSNHPTNRADDHAKSDGQMPVTL